MVRRNAPSPVRLSRQNKATGRATLGGGWVGNHAQKGIIMSIPRSNVPVNTPVMFANEQHADADARIIDRAERLAMTAAEMIRAAENRWQAEYGLDVTHQGGYGRVEVIAPYHDPSALPWVHLLPVGWVQNPSGSWQRTYLVRGTGDQYGSPDWTESDNMREWLNTRDDTSGVMTTQSPT